MTVPPVRWSTTWWTRFYGSEAVGTTRTSQAAVFSYWKYLPRLIGRNDVPVSLSLSHRLGHQPRRQRTESSFSRGIIVLDRHTVNQNSFISGLKDFLVNLEIL